MTAETIKIGLSSQKFNEKKAFVEEDAHVSFSRFAQEGVAVFGTTESGADPVRSVVERVAPQYGYTPFFAGEGDVHLFALKGYTVTAHGFVHVLDALHAPASQGGHGPRPIQWMDVDTPGGNHVSVLIQHWLTGFRLGNHPGDNKRREAFFLQETQAMAREVVARGAGRHIAFWMGDVNEDAHADTGVDPGGIEFTFNQAGLQSLYDDLGEYPPTNGTKVIDWIGYYKGDKRVEPVSVTVFPKQKKDHQDVMGVFDIRQPRPRRHRQTLL